MSRIDESFDIQAYMTKGVENVVADALKATFKAVYGQPIAAYMKQYRAREAARLLRETAGSVAEIARAVGYESQSKFTRAFREVEGISPTEYRREQRENRRE